MLRLRSRRVPRQVRSSVRFVCESVESRVLLAAVNWTGGGDGVNWTNAANWSSNPSLPGPADDVTISVAANPTISLTGTQTINSLVSDEALNISGTLSVAAASSLNATTGLTGTLSGSGDITITGTLNWTSGTMSGSGKTIIASGATLNISGLTKNLNRILQNDGTGSWTAGLVINNGGTFNNNGSFSANFGGSETWRGDSGTNAFNNAGTFTKLGAGEAQFAGSTPMPFNNTGTVDVQAGTLTLSAGVTQHVGTTLTGGTWIARNAGRINISTGSNILTNQGTVVLDGTGSSFAKINTLTTNSGTFTLRGRRNFTALPVGGTFTNADTINLGAGSVLSVTGAFTQPGSALSVDIAGPVAGTDFGQVTATGAVNLNGTLNANLVGGYDPSFAVSFPVVVGASRTGTFSTFGGSGSTPSNRLLIDRYTATSAIVSVRPLAPSQADLVASSDSGVSASDDITNDNTPTFDGTATDVATVNIYADGNLVGSAPVGGGGAWSATASALADGARVITATIVDADGDESPLSGPLTVTIDTVAPAQPGAMDLQTASDSGVSGTDNITNINTPVFDLASTDTYHRVERNGGQITGDYATGITLAEGSLADGDYSYVLLAVDAAGNVSTPSGPLVVTIDTVAPAVPGSPDLQAGSDSGVSSTDNITNINTPTFDVSATDLYYRLERGGVQVSGDYATGAFTSAALVDGVYNFAARSVDAAGNVSAAGAALAVTIDTVGLAAPTTQFLFEMGQSITFAFGEDVAATLVNSDVIVQNLTGGGTVGTLLSYSNPTATFTFTGGILPDGNYRATIAAANVTDLAGNPLGGDAALDFFVFAGDANRDRTVNISDFSILASRFNLPGTFSQGDFDYSGTVGIGDFSILASKFNTSLPAPGSLARQSTLLPAGLRVAPTAEPRRLFSDLRLDDAEALPRSA